MRTEQIVNQIVLAASWDFSDERRDPVDAAIELLGINAADGRLARVRALVAAAGDSITWEEKVGLVAHTLLAREHAPLAAAA